MPLGHMTCGSFSSPGFPRETTLAEDGSKVRASQCGITALGGHPNPAVPCLILRKLSSVSSSSWGGGSHSSGVLRQPGQAPQLPGPWWKMMDFLKNLLVSVPRLWRDACHLGRRNRDQGQRDCVEWGDGGHGTESGTSTFSPWPVGQRWGSWLRTGQNLPLCPSDKASWHRARA